MLKLVPLLLLLAFGVTLSGVAGPGVEIPPEAPPPSDPYSLSPEGAAWAESVLEGLTLEQKVGQLFVTHANATQDGTSGAEWRRLTDLVENFGVGGVLFLRGDADKQAQATRSLQERAEIPVLVSQDMEWGPGMRLNGGTSFPFPMALGATRNPDLAYLMGKAIAEEARAMGVHQNYAPVADVNNNPLNPIINTRSFGENPDLVAAMTTAYVRGMQDGGMIATVKHFPGHGDTETDSHSALPVLPFQQARLDSLELRPFRAAVDAGVLSVMTGHLELPALDAERPATLSPRIITGLLRDDLGFDGLVVTDGLNMRGVQVGRSMSDVVVMALEAGVDQLILTHDEYRAKAAVLRAIQRGRLDESRIDASVRRILRAKAWAGLAPPLAPLTAAQPSGDAAAPEPPPLNNRAARRARFADLAPPTAAFQRRTALLADAIARESITLIQAPDGPVPFVGPDAPERFLTVILNEGEDSSTGETFSGSVAAQVPSGGRATHRHLGLGDRQSSFDEVLAQVPLHDVVLAAAFVRVLSSSGQIELPARHKRFVERMMEQGRPVILLAFGNPYVPLGLPKPDAYLAAYSSSDESQRAAADALFGRIAIRGRLPVSIPGQYRYDEGISLEQIALRDGAPEEAGLSPDVLEQIDSVLREALASRAFPGAAVAIGRGGVLVKHQSYGHFTYAGVDRVQPNSLYDLASVTKVVATTTAAMRLVDEGRLDLDARVAQYVPAFGQAGKEQVTVRQLLAHQAGQRAFHPFHTDPSLQSRAAILDFIYTDPVRYPPGSRTVYSDFDMIVLAEVIEAVTDEPLDVYVREAIFEPLGMDATTFRSTGRRDPTVVPTEQDRAFRGRLLQGEVHDEAAWLLGGVSGHAGLFSTAGDLSRFAYTLTQGGTAYGTRLFRQETLETFTTRVTARGQYPMALGWMTWRPQDEGDSSAGTLFGPRSYGHTGYTGTSLWIDPEEELFVILLTNRVHPTRRNSRIRNVRPALANAVAGAIRTPAGRHWQMLGFGLPPDDLLQP